MNDKHVNGLNPQISVTLIEFLYVSIYILLNIYKQRHTIFVERIKVCKRRNMSSNLITMITIKTSEIRFGSLECMSRIRTDLKYHLG